MNTAEQILLSAILSAAVYRDFQTDCIPNELILAGFGCSVCTCLYVRVPLFALDRFAGALLPLLCLYPLWYLHMIGAGDVKLLMMCGAFLGYRDAFGCLLAALCWGGAVSILLICRRREANMRLMHFSAWIRKVCQTGRTAPYIQPGDTGGRMHFALPVLLGVITVLCRRG